MIRSLDPGDARSVLELEEEIFGPEAWSYQAVSEELGSPWADYRGMFDEDGALIAYGGIKGEESGDLMTLAVASHRRREGRARRLLTDLLTRATKRGMAAIFLEVRASNLGAQMLYRDAGFEALRLVPGYYRTPPEDAVSMMLTLPTPPPQPPSQEV